MGTSLRSLDPYQLLFPIGLTHALLGLFQWIAFALHWTPYPAVAHAHHMVSGFLVSFSAGFLLTAIPRFTGTDRCSPSELLAATLISSAALLVPSAIFPLAMFLLIAIFFGRRFHRRTFTPPPHFIFIPAGILFGMYGTVVLTLVDFAVIGVEWLPTARLFFFYGTMLFFVLGIGAKLISALLGWGELPFVTIERPASRASLTLAMAQPWLEMALLAASFFLEANAHVVVGRSLRAACATSIAMQRWRLYRLPKQNGKLAFWLWIGGWNLLLGLWAHALAPDLGVHAAHWVFIGGFALTTLMVASRVTLAHGGYPLVAERRSPVFLVTGLLLTTAALTRVAAPWTTSYPRHLAYSALCATLGAWAWGFYFVPKMIRRSKN